MDQSDIDFILKSLEKRGITVNKISVRNGKEYDLILSKDCKSVRIAKKGSILKDGEKVLTMEDLLLPRIYDDAKDETDGLIN